MTNTAPRSRKLLAVFTLLIFTVAAFASAPLVDPQAGPAQVSQIDLLIRGGKVLDGSGSPPFRADVGIRGDRIVFTGDAKKAGLNATRTIEAAQALDEGALGCLRDCITTAPTSKPTS